MRLGSAGVASPCCLVGGEGGGCEPRHHDTPPGKDSTATPTPAAARFQQLLEGLDAPGDSGQPPLPPPWLDRALFEKGRQFYRRYFFCVFLSDLVSLVMLFSVNRILRPLMYTGRSHTPLRALRRYVSTIAHVVAWYSGDVWDPQDPAHHDILQVRRIHQAAAATFNAPHHRAGVDAATVAGRGHPARACPFNTAVRQDLRGCAGPGAPLEARPALYLSQWDQAFTQYAFMGVMLAHPWRMGAWWVTEEELAGFLHFWRGAGWLLGIEDRYNFCSGSVVETVALCREVEQRVVVPGLAGAAADHQVMATALTEGLSHMVPGFSYPAVVRLLADTLGLATPALSAAMSLRHRLHYTLLRVVTHGLLLLPCLLPLLNGVLWAALRAVRGAHPRWRPKVTVTPYTY